MRYSASPDFSGIAIIIFLVLLAMFGGMFVILNHHWQKYEIEPRRTAKLRFVFLAVGSVLLVLLLVFMVPLLP